MLRGPEKQFSLTCGALSTSRHKKQCPFRTKARSVTLLSLGLVSFCTVSALADGCFVFKWNKGIDINEPTQKAIIVHKAGREDLLLQVKYEGPVEEFGWLIPVPSLPTVEKGSMEPFYELSRLTQREFAMRAGTLGGTSGQGRGEESVKVVEVKTVGAYEISILSARDSGALDHWLKAHDYNIPDGNAAIIDDYIRNGWYFIAAKIQLDRGVAFKLVNNASPKASADTDTARKILKRQLSAGELHPLLISFDSPRCVFPLKISSINGKPAEISLYVLSSEALLERSSFDQALRRLHAKHVEWDESRRKDRAERIKNGRICMLNSRSLALSWQLYALTPGRQRDWTLEDLTAMSEEGLPPMPAELLDDDSFWGDSFLGLPYELLNCLQVTPGKMPQSAKAMPRLKTAPWFLTKLVRTFSSQEMHDLEFEPAIPIVARILPSPEGLVSATLLSQLGSNAVPVLVAASASINTIERISASSVVGWPPDQRYTETIRRLLKDDVPLVRLHATTAASRTWDPSFAEPLFSLLRDEQMEIRHAATIWLRFHVTEQEFPQLLGMLREPDPDLQSSALQILSYTNSAAIPRADLLRLLSSPRLATVSLALGILDAGQHWLYGTSLVVSGSPNSARTQNTSLSSEEAAPLLTNRVTMARLMGLKVLQQNADAPAVQLALPCLRDTSSIVRNRAFGFLHEISGEDIPPDKPEKWEQWWTANEASFAARRSGR